MFITKKKLEELIKEKQREVFDKCEEDRRKENTERYIEDRFDRLEARFNEDINSIGRKICDIEDKLNLNCKECSCKKK